MNGVGLNMMSNQVKFGVDMLGSIMKSRILGQLDCKSIFTYFSCKYSRIFLSYIISFVTYDVAIYSSSIVEYVGIDYLCDLKEIAADPRLMREPKVDTPFYLSSSKCESGYPI